MTIEMVQKRDGRLVPFDESKIADAIFKAAKAVGGEDISIAEELASVVTHFLQKKFKDKIPGIEDIQDLVEEILIKNGHAKTAKAFILYREKRGRIRKSLRVSKQVRKGNDTTDAALMVDLVTKDESFPWDKRKNCVSPGEGSGFDR
ncbi:MAG: anaerobic ribonucleoside-triphosphate reductase [Candidatus Scalindua rubra]|uniref:Anaerobic ribonucleoside-triphosphate reductase n=1 Tax=Candidatus Scalindua rubra TaxID=1872076 RepID=A0A1E3XFR1_9BACT|nr:MAG: anaerobic ribonucleoside-triphosphate reductase [Candidatus Scalindua rubra]